MVVVEVSRTGSGVRGGGFCARTVLAAMIPPATASAMWPTR